MEFPAAVFLGVTLAYLLLTGRHDRYQMVDVAQQVKDYPADEQWITVSADAYNSLREEAQRALHAACRKEGIRLLRVHPAARVAVLETPLPRKVSKVHAEFLECYARSDRLRRELRAKADQNRR